jgi:hypothetical protein
MAAGHSVGMSRPATKIIATTLLIMLGTKVGAQVMVCTDPDEPSHSYTVAGDHGAYTWNDHGVARSWELKCNKHRGGSTTCHRWERYDEKGRSVIIFRMLPDGTLIEAGSWGVLNVSSVSVTPGFLCTTEGE